jgi:hypothetical protein
MRFVTILVFALLGASNILVAGQASRLSPEERQALLAYQLTLPRANQLITAMDAMTKYLVSLPDYQERMAKSMKLTAAERGAQLDNDPKASAILKQNGLTARDYLVGVPALRMALIAAQGGGENPNIVASPANVAFAKSHLTELKPKMDAADGLRRR